MSWKSFACVAALSALTAPALAAPSLSFIDNSDGTGTFQISPDATLFSPDLGPGGSIAFEIEVDASVAIVSGLNGTLFPTANPGGFDSGVETGLNISGNTITAAFGSDIFTSGAAVDALTIDLGGAGTFDYDAVVAQAGANNVFAGSDAITDVGTPIDGDFNGDGAVDNGDLNLLLGNWGSATVPGEWVNGFTPVVDNSELNLLLGNWGAGTSTAIPEPTTVMLASLAGVALCVRRRV